MSVLKCKSHISDPSATEVPVTTESIHPALYLTLIAIPISPPTDRCMRRYSCRDTPH